MEVRGWLRREISANTWACGLSWSGRKYKKPGANPAKAAQKKAKKNPAPQADSAAQAAQPDTAQSNTVQPNTVQTQPES